MKDADWMAVLRQECTSTPERPSRSMSQVARELGVSVSAISTILKGTYPASTKRIEELVRGRYMAATVQCPALGEIPLDKCHWWQGRTIETASHYLARRMFFACRQGCPHSRLKPQFDQNRRPLVEVPR